MWKQIIALAESLGAHVNDYGKDDLVIDSPNNHIWACDFIHVLHCDGSTKEDYRDLLDRMSQGILECEDDMCPYCDKEQ